MFIHAVTHVLDCNFKILSFRVRCVAVCISTIEGTYRKYTMASLSVAQLKQVG